MKLTLSTIPEADEAEFIEAIIAMKRVPQDSDGQPMYTDKEWVIEWGCREYMKVYESGRRRLGEQTAVINKNIMVRE